MVNRLLFLSGKCLSNVFKKKSIKMKKLLAFCFMVCCAVAQAQLVTYPEGLKTGMPHNDDYTVRVRVPGGEWKDLFEYNVQVDMDRVQDASMVQFDMGSLVEVMVKKNIFLWSLMGIGCITFMCLPIRWKRRLTRKKRKE